MNPFNHYEVECNKLKTIFVGEDRKDAEAVYLDCQSSQKAIIHVRDKQRIVEVTNAPYMYLRGKLTQPLLNQEEPNAT